MAKASKIKWLGAIADVVGERTRQILEEHPMELSEAINIEVGLKLLHEVETRRALVKQTKTVTFEWYQFQDARENWNDWLVENADALIAATKERDELRAEVERLRAALGWQPIKGAAHFRHIGPLPEAK